MNRHSADETVHCVIGHHRDMVFGEADDLGCDGFACAGHQKGAVANGGCLSKARDVDDEPTNAGHPTCLLMIVGSRQLCTRRSDSLLETNASFCVDII
jgi:hypothetical protein